MGEREERVEWGKQKESAEEIGREGRQRWS